MADQHFDRNNERMAFEEKMAAMYADPLFSDLTIKTSQGSIRAYKNIMCTASDWFRTALTGDFKEAQSSELSLEADDPDAVNALVEYIYTLKIGMSASLADEAIVLYAKVFATAEKYLMPGLQKLASDKLKAVADTASSAALAEAIDVVYTQCLDREELLRPCIIDHVLGRIELLRDQDAHPEFRKRLSNTPGFAMDITTAMAKGWQKTPPKTAPIEKTYRCPGCNGSAHNFKATIPYGQTYLHYCSRYGNYSGDKQWWDNYATGCAPP